MEILLKLFYAEIYYQKKNRLKGCTKLPEAQQKRKKTQKIFRIVFSCDYFSRGIGGKLVLLGCLEKKGRW